MLFGPHWGQSFPARFENQKCAGKDRPLCLLTQSVMHPLHLLLYEISAFIYNICICSAPAGMGIMQDKNASILDK